MGNIHNSFFTIIISILNVGCCQCPIQWSWQDQATSNTGSPYVYVLRNNKISCTKPIEAKWRIYAQVNKGIIDSDNGLSPGRRQAIIWTNTGLLSIAPFGTNFSDILIETHTFSIKKINFKMSSGKSQPFVLGRNVLIRVKQRKGSSNIDVDVTSVVSNDEIWLYV